jgi:tuberculosinol/isotuberculosinol synthase
VDVDTFQSLPTEEVAQIVREAGPKVCVFPINGTRRWFVLECASGQGDEGAPAYLDIMFRRHVELYRLIFDHGVGTLLTPAFGPDLMERGDGYVETAIEGLEGLCNHPTLVDFYESHGVRVRFYGDYARHLRATPGRHLAGMFQDLERRTAAHDKHRLFFGLFAHDAAERVAELAVAHYLEHGSVPGKPTLIELYYGEYVEPVDFFIGFDKLAVFDMPLVATGDEDLYFTVSPSLYLGERQLRAILYDHLYTRRQAEPDYPALGPEDWAAMKDFYDANRESTIGVGARRAPGGFWVPLPQVALPEGMT